jgi:hypothetical protein
MLVLFSSDNKQMFTVNMSTINRCVLLSVTRFKFQFTLLMEGKNRHIKDTVSIFFFMTEVLLLTNQQDQFDFME